MRSSWKRIGIIELIAYTVSSEWAMRASVARLKQQYYSIMPQVIAVWCRELGHRVTYATYYGQADPCELLPDDLDIVFIAASTQASALAYALAKLYRARGVFTVAGGPHAKCFPEDCTRFFDVTVIRCDRDLIASIVSGSMDPPAVVGSEHVARVFPSIEERLPELRIASFGGERPRRTSVISLFGSTGCPYTCGFCTDWNTEYSPVSVDDLQRDLSFAADRFPGVVLGFQDPNFGIQFDRTMSALESMPGERRSPYLMQCSLAILTPERMQRLQATKCLYVAPGVESWFEFGNKMRLAKTHGADRVKHLAGQFRSLYQYVPGLQANFVLGLDSDHDDSPFTLTREFFNASPFVWPNINILTPYGGTPTYQRLWAEGRLLASMPFALYCSPYLALVMKSYEALEFYDRFIELIEASTSLALTLRRAVLPDHPLIKFGRLAQTIAVRLDIREMRVIRDELLHDAKLRAFHSGKTETVPDFYLKHLWRRLGRFAELLSLADCVPIHRSN